MPTYAIVETDTAKTETTKELHFKIELDEVGEVETIFSRRHDVVEADDAHKTATTLSNFVLPSKSLRIYNIISTVCQDLSRKSPS